jgi:hypothetical protein
VVQHRLHGIATSVQSSTMLCGGRAEAPAEAPLAEDVAEVAAGQRLAEAQRPAPPQAPGRRASIGARATTSIDRAITALPRRRNDGGATAA